MRRWAVLLAITTLSFVVAPATVAAAGTATPPPRVIYPTPGGTTFPGFPTTNPHAPGYPPTTTIPFIPPTLEKIIETFLIGHHFVVEECGFMPDTTASWSYNGTHLGIFVVDKAGCISITIYVYDPHVTINGGPLEPAAWSDNTVVAVGEGNNTASRTYTLIFNILQPNQGGNSQGGNQGGNSQGSNGSGAPGVSGSLAFTGSNVLATAVGGLALLVAGTVLVLFTRRRSHDRRPATVQQPPA